jgi:outer membrane protein TolC
MKYFVLLLLLLGASRVIATTTDSTEPPLSFNDALKVIIGRHPQKGIQTNNVELTRANNLSTQLGMLPEITLQGIQNYTRSIGNTPDLYGTYQGTALLNLFHFGSDLAGMRAAGKEVEAQSITLDDTILKIENDGVQSLISLIENQKTVEILDDMMDLRLLSIKIAKERYNRGLLPTQEVDKISVDYDNSLARLKDAESNFARAKAELERLLGHSRVIAEWPWKNSFGELDSKSWETDKTPDLSHRPDWRAAKKTVEAASDRLTQSWGKMFPSLDFSFSYGFGEDEYSGQNGPEYSAMLTLTIPLFDRLANYGQYRSQVYTQSNAELELEQTKRQAKSEWEASQRSFLISLDSAKARDKTVETSKRLYETNLKRFRAGFVSANDLAFDQDRLYNSQLFAIRGWASVHTYFTNRSHALGLRVSDEHLFQIKN